MLAPYHKTWDVSLVAALLLGLSTLGACEREVNPETQIERPGVTQTLPTTAPLSSTGEDSQVIGRVIHKSDVQSIPDAPYTSGLVLAMPSTGQPTSRRKPSS